MTEGEYQDRTGAIAQAFYLLNLLFTGIGLVVIVYLYLRKRATASNLVRQHLHQCLLATAITSVLFLLFNILIISRDGYFSMSGLIILEVYYMIIVPICFVPGIIGLNRALKGQEYYFPLVGKLVS